MEERVKIKGQQQIGWIYCRLDLFYLLNSSCSRKPVNKKVAYLDISSFGYFLNKHFI